MTTELMEAPAPVAVSLLRPPAALSVVQYAVQSGAPLSEVRALVEMQIQMDNHQLTMLRAKSEMEKELRVEESAKQFAEAMAGFKGESVTVIRNKLITDGPLKGKKHADLFSVVNAATGAMSRHGLSATWRTVADDKDWIKVACVIRHIGGHSEQTEFGGPVDNGPGRNAIQARKSTLSYLNRITMLLALGLAEQDADDDGAGGAGGNSAAAGKAIEARDGWIMAINECETRETCMATWKNAQVELEPMNRLDIHAAVRKALTERLEAIKGAKA